MALTDPPSSPALGLHTAMQHGLLRAYFAAALVLCGLGALSTLLFQPQLPGLARGLILAGYAVLAALCHAGLRRPVAPALGRLPWLIPGVQLDADGTALLQAAMAQRAPLRDLPIGWLPALDSAAQGPAGAPGQAAPTRHYLASGEPRFDRAGQFIGYWGVVRDVTAQHQARQALAVTESRYQALFMRIPTPLMLHQGGTIIDANPAAARWLGYGSVPPMLWRCPADRHHLMRAVESEGTVQDMLADFVARDGRVVPLQISGRRIDIDGRAYR